MDGKEIRDLIGEFKDSPLSFLEIKDGETYLKMKKPVGGQPQPAPAQAPAFNSMPFSASSEVAAAQAPVADFESLVEVASPIVGVFYEAPAPGEKPFVAVGDHVEEGDVLCLMEAMKMISEVKSPCAGTIREICVANEEAVGCDQVLIRIEAD